MADIQLFQWRQSLYALPSLGAKDTSQHQETFYQAFLHIDRFEGRSSVYTWLCQIGKNAWLKECRRRKWLDRRDWKELELADDKSPPEETAIRRYEYAQARKAVLELEEPYREVLIMHTFGEVSLKEIAMEHGKSESWARVTYLRAKKRSAYKKASEKSEEDGHCLWLFCRYFCSSLD